MYSSVPRVGLGLTGFGAHERRTEVTALTPFARPPTAKQRTGDEYVDRGRAARRRCVQTQHKTRTRHTQRQTTALLLFSVL